jgi:serine protease inhibitor
MPHSPLKIVFLRFAAGALLLAGCQKEPVTPDNFPKLRPLTAAEVSTVGSSNDFAFRSFAALRQGAEGNNLCLSPLSVSAALTMAYNGADGSTKADMKQALGFAPQTDAEINESFQSLFALLTGLDKRVTFTAANSIWHGQQYQLAAPFVQQNQTYFGATVQGVNFSSPTAKEAINGWVKDKTQGRITSIVEQTQAADVMYLVNALYFKGAWTYPFDARQTYTAPFHKEDGSTTNVNMMRQAKANYLHYADDRQQVIDLPYGNGQFSMTLVVPQGETTLAEVAQRMTRTQLDTWLAAAYTSDQELQLPKFKLEYAKQLKDVLTQLGMGVAFTEQANFGRMLVGSPKGLFISEVKHKTFLEVNEEGTEAAAATSVGMVTTSLPRALVVNRPFLFLIREKSSGAILFIGQLTNP